MTSESLASWFSPGSLQRESCDRVFKHGSGIAGNTHRRKDAKNQADCADAATAVGTILTALHEQPREGTPSCEAPESCFRSSLTCAATLAICAACTPPPAANVEPTPAAAALPDLSGVWMAFAVENPDGGGNATRFSPEGQALLDAFAAQFTSIPETGAWCYGTGMPSVMLSTVSYPIEIVQHASRLVMLAELEMQVRRVYLDGRPHPEDYLSSGVGHSVGTWDGDTLVIDTTLLSEWQLPPWPRTEQTQIVERVYLTKLGEITARPSGFVASVEKPVNDDVLVVEMTLTDADALRRPAAAHGVLPAHVRHRHARVRVLGRALAGGT